MKRKIEFTPRNIGLYIFGVFILGLGAVSGTASNLGAGSWDTVSKNLATTTGIEFGYASWAIAAAVMILILVITRAYYKVFMLLPAAFLSLSLLFWENVIFNDYSSTSLATGIPLFISAIIFIPMGLASIVASNFPAFVFDELNILLMDIFKTNNLKRVRFYIEVFGMVLGTAIGFIGGIGFGVVGFGTIVLSFTIGPTIQFYLKVLKMEMKQNE